MNLYDANITEKKLLKDLNTTNMVNFLDLQTLARKNSFKAKGYNIDKKVFQQLHLPVIARILRHKDYPQWRFYTLIRPK